MIKSVRYLHFFKLILGHPKVKELKIYGLSDPSFLKSNTGSSGNVSPMYPRDSTVLSVGKIALLFKQTNKRTYKIHIKINIWPY